MNTSTIWQSQAYHSSIIYNIKILNFYDEPYRLYHIRYLPINKTNTILTPKPYIIMNEFRYQYLSTPCQSFEQLYFCKLESLRKRFSNSCITKVINNELARCDLVETLDNEYIEVIELEHLLISTNTNLHL